MKIWDCSFLYYMPNVQYLMLGDTRVSDLTPIGSLTKLKSLELFMTQVTNLWPLVNCTALEDLNLCFAPIEDQTPLFRMSHLNRLWAVYTGFSYEQQQALRQALPETVILFGSDSSTNKGWRHSPNYYQQRDIVGMWYMVH